MPLTPWMQPTYAPSAGEGDERSLEELRRKYPGMTDRALGIMQSEMTAGRWTAAEPPSPPKQKWTWPWQEEHWGKVAPGAPFQSWLRPILGEEQFQAGMPGWVDPALRATWTGSLTTLGTILGGHIGGGGGYAASLATKPGVPQTATNILGLASKVPAWLSALIGGTTGLTAGQTPITTPAPPAEEAAPVGAEEVGLPPPGGELPYTPSVEPIGEPQIIEVGGQRFWWNPTGGAYGAGGWQVLGGAAGGLSAEQQIEQARLGREAQMARLQMQYRLEQEAMGRQAEQQRGTQEAQAAQQMAQMYAADPYKYWAQMGMGTPGAVARLTRGGVEAGTPMQQVPLSVPSAQWWQNLMPSEQQQIAGGLNWLGVNPEDWYSMYQRMIPGREARQTGPVWAR